MNEDKITGYFRTIEDVARKAAVGSAPVDKSIEQIDELLTDICEVVAS